MYDAPMADSHPNTRTGRDATQLTDTASPNLTTALEGEISREQSSPDAKDSRRLSQTSTALQDLNTVNQGMYYMYEQWHYWS